MPIQATRLETEEDVRRALVARRPEAASAKSPVSRRPAPADDAPPFFRPFLRPTTPIVTICDDGAESGESLRIRKKEFVIGRSEGDLTIPHDGQMSSRHAMFRQTSVRNQLRWALIDLNSKNGTFVRVGHALLEDGSEFVVGRTRLRFENESGTRGQGTNGTPASAADQATQPWRSPNSRSDVPAIVELTDDGMGRRVMLNKPEIWMGKDSAHCQIVLADEFVSARHARVRCDEDGRWVLENNKSVNGVWLKIDQIAIKESCRFMLGEQLFLFQVP
ncbi:MAG TPA: FHA domain-containing protein [Lacipirellulaceae bacterium]|jgi:pSer/pThr/pTyr-binding forkhead associated (FHA) protein|nr:FHA domain-containing protein [Lacipirellulaceae bacterium]